MRVAWHVFANHATASISGQVHKTHGASVTFWSFTVPLRWSISRSAVMLMPHGFVGCSVIQSRLTCSEMPAQCRSQTSPEEACIYTPFYLTSPLSFLRSNILPRILIHQALLKESTSFLTHHIVVQPLTASAHDVSLHSGDLPRLRASWRQRAAPMLPEIRRNWKPRRTLRPAIRHQNHGSGQRFEGRQAPQHIP